MEMTLFDTLEVIQDPRVELLISKCPELMGEGWYKLMKQYMERNFSKVVSFLLSEADAGKRIYPGSARMFRCFQECPLDSLKVIFIAQDPYHQRGIADGLAFSCGLSNREQPSLKLIYDEVQRTAWYYGFARTPSLQKWANQGVLLMNTALTVEDAKPGSHTEVWESFIKRLLMKLNEEKKDIIYIFVGAKAKQFQGLVSGESNIKINVIHPAAAAHRGGNWDCEDIFNRINDNLKAQNKSIINW